MQGRIIGAGIGGLVVALALQRLGLNAKVYEAADHPVSDGAGIIMAVNAMRILNELNLADKIIQKGNEIHSVYITDEKLQPLSPNMVPDEAKKQGFANVAIHRIDLQNILLRHLPEETVEWDKKCIRIVSNGNHRYKINFEDGETAYGDYVIGADGIHSTVRKLFFPGAKIRDVKQICWRGVTVADLPGKFHHQATEAWGRGKRFGFSRINKDYVYWFAVMNKHGSGFNFRKDLRNELKKQFADFDPIISELIEDTPESRIIRKDLSDLISLPSWHSEGICLLGDAAHAATPNLGQGACQAIEDGWVLADLLNASKNPGMAFPQYQKIRKPMTDYVGKWSLRVGNIAHYENAFLTGLRNTILKNMPHSFFQKKTTKLFSPAYEI